MEQLIPMLRNFPGQPSHFPWLFQTFPGSVRTLCYCGQVVLFCLNSAFRFFVIWTKLPSLYHIILCASISHWKTENKLEPYKQKHLTHRAVACAVCLVAATSSFGSSWKLARLTTARQNGERRTSTVNCHRQRTPTELCDVLRPWQRPPVPLFLKCSAMPMNAGWRLINNRKHKFAVKSKHNHTFF